MDQTQQMEQIVYYRLVDANGLQLNVHETFHHSFCPRGIITICIICNAVKLKCGNFMSPIAATDLIVYSPKVEHIIQRCLGMSTLATDFGKTAGLALV